MDRAAGRWAGWVGPAGLHSRSTCYTMPRSATSAVPSQPVELLIVSFGANAWDPPGPGWLGFLLNLLYLAVYYTMLVPHATISLLAGESA